MIVRDAGACVEVDVGIFVVGRRLCWGAECLWGEKIVLVGGGLCGCSIIIAEDHCLLVFTYLKHKYYAKTRVGQKHCSSIFMRFGIWDGVV